MVYLQYLDYTSYLFIVGHIKSIILILPHKIDNLNTNLNT